MLHFDHIAIACARLDDGVAAVEAALGVQMAGGGEHAAMGTHNRLLGLGDLYLEVIAIDPDAPAPKYPRWFDLDRFSGPPRLVSWICRCDDIAAELAQSPPGAGRPLHLKRGDLAWQMAVPADGQLPFDNTFPALIEWQGTAHPVQRLPDSGARLERLEVIHPDAAVLHHQLAPRLSDPRVVILPGAAPALRVSISTPSGLRHLSS